MPTHSFLRSTKGFTLVELMIVVAIIGVLSGLAIAGYSRFTTTAKISNLEALAQEAAVGQNDPQRSGYYPPATASPFIYNPNTNKKQLKAFLKVNPNNVPPDVTLNVCAGGRSDSCSSECCEDITFDTTQGDWYVVRAEQNMDGDTTNKSTAVIKTSANKYTVTLNHGQ